MINEEVDLVPGHRLLPHERWCVSLGARKRQENPALRSQRIDQNYGPEGIALVNAGMATLLPAMCIGLIGAGLMLVSGNQKPLVTIAYWLIVIGIVLIFPAMFRIVQASTAGKRFRGDRPFIKRP